MALTTAATADADSVALMLRHNVRGERPALAWPGGVQNEHERTASP